MLLQTFRSSRRALRDPAPRELQVFHKLETRNLEARYVQEQFHTTEKEHFTAT